MEAQVLDPNEVITVPCGKCGGKGRIYAYLHMDSGICYECMGEGYSWKGTRKKREQLDRANEKARQRRIAKREEQEAKRELEFDLWKEENKDALDMILAFDPKKNYFVEGLQSRLNKRLYLTKAQIDAGVRAIEKIQAAPAPKRIAEGRTVVQGEVVSVKFTETQYGLSVKMLIQCDGYRLFGTRPACLSSVQRGDVVRFSAMLTETELGFGLFSRPTKAMVVTDEEVAEAV